MTPINVLPELRGDTSRRFEGNLAVIDFSVNKVYGQLGPVQFEADEEAWYQVEDHYSGMAVAMAVTGCHHQMIKTSADC